MVYFHTIIKLCCLDNCVLFSFYRPIFNFRFITTFYYHATHNLAKCFLFLVAYFINNKKENEFSITQYVYSIAY